MKYQKYKAKKIMKHNNQMKIMNNHNKSNKDKPRYQYLQINNQKTKPKRIS